MLRFRFLIDGFNLYHALDYFKDGCTPTDRARYQKYKWLSLSRLCACYVGGNDSIVGVDYFTTLANWDPDKRDRHKRFIAAQQNDGVHVTFGQFKRKSLNCKARCRLEYQVFEEKQTDVNIAVRLLGIAARPDCDVAVVMSGDTDLVPAIKAARMLQPELRFGVVLPIGRSADELKQVADLKFKMKEEHLSRSVLPDSIILPDGETVLCPEPWRTALTRAAVNPSS